MKIKTILLLAVAVGCGLVAMLGVQQSMSGFGQGEPEERVSILMAVTDIQVGEVITPENVTFREISIDTAPENAVLSEEQYKDRSALVPLMANDFVTIPKLSEPGVRGQSVNIPKGMRVVTVGVNDTTSHSGMLAAGDRVDVLVTYQSRTPRGQTTKSKVLLEYVEVFATGNKTASDGSGNDNEQKVKNVSLLVTPEQMPYVELAQKKGNLSLSWRRMDDDELVKVGEVDEELMAELQGTVDKDARGYGHPYARNDPEDLEDKPDLKSWLDQKEQEAEEAPEPEPVKVVEVALDEPAKPMWTMEIFHGEERQLVELELPEEDTGETGATGQPADRSQGASGAVDTPAAPGTEPVSAPAESTLRSLLKGLNFGQGA